MKLKCLVLGLFSVFWACCPTWAQNSAPKLLNYQGRLTNAAGQAMADGTYKLRFALYSKSDASQTGDTLIWGADYDVVVAGGQFNVVLGAAGGTAMAGAAVNDVAYAFHNPECYLQMTILSGGGISAAQVLSPRQQMLSAPYALEALHGVPTGMVLPWYGLGSDPVPVPEGWVSASGQTVGNGTSGANITGEKTRNLYRLLWKSASNSVLPILTSTGSPTSRGADADADFDASKRMSTPDMRGRVAIGTGQGNNLSNRLLGQTFGSETHTLTINEMPVHSHGVTDPGHTHTAQLRYSGGAGGGATLPNLGYRASSSEYGNSNPDANVNKSTTGVSVNNTGGGAAHDIMPPSLPLTYLIKL